jgi:adenylate kinase
MVRLVLLGPPGAGKGTQATVLARELGVIHLSTGELLREEVRRGTALGAEADRFVRAGQLVPNDLVLRILAARLEEPTARAGFILDGYPRTAAQAETLTGITPIDHVLFFELPEGLLVGRLTQRRSCPTCGRTYNLTSLPPARPGVCDVEGSPLIQRSDDRPEAVETRLKVYREQTAPLLDYYERKGRLRRIDARGAPGEVTARLRAALARRPE